MAEHRWRRWATLLTQLLSTDSSVPLLVLALLLGVLAGIWLLRVLGV